VNTQQNPTQQAAAQAGKQRVMLTPKQDTTQYTSAMSDRDYANDMLTTEKYITSGLNTALWEASNSTCHQDLLKMLNETHQAARRVYDYMFQQGWYPLEVETQEHLNQAYQQYSQYATQQFPPSGMMH